MQPITLQPGQSLELAINDPVLERAITSGFRVQIFPGAVQNLGEHRFRQPFLVQIDGADYRTFQVEWREKQVPWWKRWKLRVYRQRGKAEV